MWRQYGEISHQQLQLDLNLRRPLCHAPQAVVSSSTDSPASLLQPRKDPHSLLMHPLPLRRPTACKRKATE
ncbi:hypothetical protein BCR34DRAFT_565590 [Clohesyomyces aquaticus]|uniref:Uncharacterized protein n=1 Tax=Clohesyomyces aquaticus TaxID=1231657 RepID=A0A1Y1ZMK2_9PLEO|nr:hypothetical protein BCR34DRAFT_565590 [Clohesyomyces aquaticus]